ncbi:MAG: hypothetical protein E6Q98_04470 [Rhodospirillaceae bacterium]|nr:MAG: hypothetical protein E6Q98_04470 [Rhodospirillaceae bacterium]
MKPVILLSALLLAAGAASAQAQQAQAQLTQAQLAQAQTESPASVVKTFPPKSDCDFLNGRARQHCLDRRGAASQENPKPLASTPGATTVVTPTLPSSGGRNPAFSNQGMIGGLNSMSTLPDSEPMSAPRGNTYSPNSIGNPWAGTPNASGTGLMPR